MGHHTLPAPTIPRKVSEAGYSGFSLGWGWGTVYPPGFGNNTISYNRIYDVMTKMKDGGGESDKSDESAEFTFFLTCVFQRCWS